MESYRLPAETLKQMPWAYRGAGAFGSKVEVEVLIQRGDLADDDPVDPSEPRTNEVVQSGRPAKIPDGLQGGLPRRLSAVTAINPKLRVIVAVALIKAAHPAIA